jgi:hypothetical protein
METILDILRDRLREFRDRTNENPKVLEVSKEELIAYINYMEDLMPTFNVDDEGTLVPLVAEMPLYCSFRGIPLKCVDKD